MTRVVVSHTAASTTDESPLVLQTRGVDLQTNVTEINVELDGLDPKSFPLSAGQLSAVVRAEGAGVPAWVYLRDADENILVATRVNGDGLAVILPIPDAAVDLQFQPLDPSQQNITLLLF